VDVHLAPEGLDVVAAVHRLVAHGAEAYFPTLISKPFSEAAARRDRSDQTGGDGEVETPPRGGTYVRVPEEHARPAVVSVEASRQSPPTATELSG
jgi:hypothetical protein